MGDIYKDISQQLKVKPKFIVLVNSTNTYQSSSSGNNQGWPLLGNNVAAENLFTAVILQIVSEAEQVQVHFNLSVLVLRTFPNLSAGLYSTEVLLRGDTFSAAVWKIDKRADVC